MCKTLLELLRGSNERASVQKSITIVTGAQRGTAPAATLQKWQELHGAAVRVETGRWRIGLFMNVAAVIAQISLCCCSLVDTSPMPPQHVRCWHSLLPGSAPRAHLAAAGWGVS